MSAEKFFMKSIIASTEVQAIVGGTSTIVGTAAKTPIPVGTRVYPFKDDQDSVYPLITYRCVPGGEVDPDLPFEWVYIEVRCWDYSYSVASKLSKAVKHVLHKSAGGCDGKGILKVLADTANEDEYRTQEKVHTVARIYKACVEE